jgi:hypothetical protein
MRNLWNRDILGMPVHLWVEMTIASALIAFTLRVLS